ncbi:Putative histidine kinase/HSP90-like ATPase superfamily [Colletotrichum destructivum]|uniref:Histidine kinase/HSP90-like ATPase superfamily n=1 Tax=Colletotrichum destructivum TaxID=34406 RepID=A0AAX4I8L5_9PEZI|nr:Putative histidine kinase/HSP90-like ATPase superfamily [Colletotrichum destructivum]
MDYSRLKAAAMQGGEDEEAVTVDTRALIDKVLARYSGEWTTLRELIQNAADAQATTVKVKWETLPSTSVALPATTNRSELLKHVIANHTLRRLVVANDGQPFTKTDWGRLKRIAEGNPDETKIGAFGVGFYSVFADCEEPFVSSGNEAMAFYWKGNALFTKKSTLPADQTSSDTTFVLDYRNSTTPLPNLLSVSQFLATSLTFVALQHVEFWIDDYKILDLHKKTSPSLDVPIPRDVETRTREGLMKVNSVERTSTQIDAAVMIAAGWKPKATTTSKSDQYGLGAEVPSLRSFFSRLTSTASQITAKREETAAQEEISEDVTKISTSTIFLRVTTAWVKTSVSTSFATELERATKKPPPKTTKLAILTSSYDETMASESSRSDTVSKSVDIFASVLPSKKPGGRIFIGFPTTQTTGAGMHISAQSVIPTVEREAIDLNARWVRTWNVEMLRAAGIMTRLAFINEMGDLDSKIRKLVGAGTKIPAEDLAKLLPEALHILKTFSFTDSTPSGQVSQIIEEAFWTAFKKASIEVFSSRGVLSSTKVRLGSDELSKFVDTIPVVPRELMENSFVRKLMDFGLISPITVDDVRTELETKAMNKEQLINFITWAGKKALSGELDPPSKARLLDVAVATVSEDGRDQGDIIALGSITNYQAANKIPANLPIPPSTIPMAYTSGCSALELQALGWEALEIVPWLRYLLEFGSSRPDEQNLKKSPKFAVQVLTVLSKNWDNISQNSKGTVVTLLQAHTVMPTKTGMKKPTDSFFPTVKLFDDLPTIQGCQGLRDKFLSAIGVRKTVDLDTIFSRLLSPSAEGGAQRWSHMELIKYLASVKDDIPAADMKKLMETRFCPAEAGPKAAEPTKGTTELYKVSELFEPQDTLRALKLPVLQWPGPPGSYRPNSHEGRFLSTLGLRPYPSVTEMVNMMSSKDAELRASAMAYFITNHHLNGYGAFNLTDSRKAFLPLQNDTRLVMPSACFTNERAAILGFDILKRDFHVHANKFGVARDPPIAECVSRLLAKPPQDRQAAITLFEYFAMRIGDLGEGSLSQLRDAPIVPVTRKSPGGSSTSEKTGSYTIHISPRRSYLGTSATYGDIFDFVDFGANANTFLFKCGAKNEPTKTEIAHLACSEPARLLNILQSPDKYLALLKSLAENMSTLKRDKDLMKKMKSSPFLLAAKEIAPPPSKDKLVDVDDDDAPIKQYQLAAANRIVILDDIISYRLFKDYLMTAPEEEVLEEFYRQLGASTLSSLVGEEVRIGPHVNNQDRAAALRKHVLERSKIFLHEYSKYRRDYIKRDFKWLEKSLQVELVRSVALRRSLQGHGHSHTEKRSAASAQSGSSWILYVVAEGQPDMYQVGQAICQLLLSRPNQQAYLFFEPFLTLDLYGLRARGYNVDRILRAKAAEARFAEEERRKALEAEQMRIQEKQQEWGQQAKAAEAARQSTRTPEPIMPGSFTNDSPDDSHKLPPPQQSWKGKGLFSNLSRRFGLDTSGNDEAEDQLQKFIDKPPQSQPQGVGNQSGSSTQKPKDDGRVTNPATVEQNLLNAINSTRAHDSDSVFSPPSVNEVKEQATYCDSTPAQNIVFAAEASNGMKVFVSRTLSMEPDLFLSIYHGSINAFASLLTDVASVYSLSPRVLHIFYDESGSTIAFNSSGSIFCNLRFFLQLHTNKSNGKQSGEAKAEAGVWWWVVLAHELAHNLVQPHNSDHSYYTESFIQQYFAKMVVKATQWTQQAASAPPAALPPPPSQPQAHTHTQAQPPPSYQESNRQAPGNPRYTLFD